jgi:hypothetical protein
VEKAVIMGRETHGDSDSTSCVPVSFPYWLLLRILWMSPFPVPSKDVKYAVPLLVWDVKQGFNGSKVPVVGVVEHRGHDAFDYS